MFVLRISSSCWEMHLLPDGASSLLYFASVIFSNVIHCVNGYKLTGMSEVGLSGTRCESLTDRRHHFSHPDQSELWIFMIYSGFHRCQSKTTHGDHSCILSPFVSIPVCSMYNANTAGYWHHCSPFPARTVRADHPLAPVHLGQASVQISVCISLRGQMKMH